jgi:protein translocase SecG subunit
MNFEFASKIAQIVLAVLLTGSILIQSKSAGLSYDLKSSFSMYRSLRGAERFIFIGTIIVGVLLVVNSFLLLVFS